MKTTKKLLSSLMVLLMLVTIIPIYNVSAVPFSIVAYADGSSVQSRIDELYNLIGEKYFNIGQNTACGVKSSGHSCDNCKTSNIVNAQWFKDLFGNCSANQFANQFSSNGEGYRIGWSCYGFANFAEWFIFKTSNSDTVSTKNMGTYNFDYANVSQYAKIGDILRLDNSHSVIFISADSNGIYVLDSNWLGSYNCKVTKHNISYSYHSSFTVSRATNYHTDTTPPSISNIKIQNRTTGYEVSCNVSDNVGVTSVKFPTWSDKNGQDDLIWHEGTITGGVAKCWIPKSQHNNETGLYITHIYAYDADGNNTSVGTGAFILDNFIEYVEVTNPSNVNQIYNLNSLSGTVNFRFINYDDDSNQVVKIKIDGNYVATDVKRDSNRYINFNYDTTNLSDGNHTITCELYDSYTCYTVSKSFAVTNHTHSYTLTETKLPTCFESGVNTFACECGDSYTEDIPIIQHEDVNNNGLCDFCGSVFVDTLSGKLGENLTWSFDVETGLLTISGTGPMEISPSFVDEYTLRELCKLIELTKSVIIEDGITTICEGAFAGLFNLESVSIPDSVTEIGACAFAFSGIKSVILPENLVEIKEGTFDTCFALEKVYIPASVKQIAVDAFSWCILLNDFEIRSEFAKNLTKEYFSFGIKKTDTFDYDVYISGVKFCLPGVLLFNGDVEKGSEYFDFTYVPGYTGRDIANMFVVDFVYDPNYEEDDFAWDVTLTAHYYDSLNETISGLPGVKYVPIHEHNYILESTVPPTCTEKGIQTFTCECGDSYIEDIAELGHDYSSEWTVDMEKTCTTDGSKSRHCSRCDSKTDVISIPGGHSFDEWIITIEATYINFGAKERVCISCGIKDTETIEKLVPSEEYENKETGVSVSVIDDSYDGEITVEVSPVYDGTSYQILNMEIGNFNAMIYDISTYIGEEKVQPASVVLVKLPIPAEYNPLKTVIYFIPNDGSPTEKMPSYVKDGFIYFETTHFSEYAIVDESQTIEHTEHIDENQDGICDVCNNDNTIGCDCSCHKTGIANFFWKIINFFQKLFGQNKVCVCGKAH